MIETDGLLADDLFLLEMLDLINEDGGKWVTGDHQHPMTLAVFVNEIYDHLDPGDERDKFIASVIQRLEERLRRRRQSAN